MSGTHVEVSTPAETSTAATEAAIGAAVEARLATEHTEGLAEQCLTMKAELTELRQEMATLREQLAASSAMQQSSTLEALGAVAEVAAVAQETAEEALETVLETLEPLEQETALVEPETMATEAEDTTQTGGPASEHQEEAAQVEAPPEPGRKPLVRPRDPSRMGRRYL